MLYDADVSSYLLKLLRSALNGITPEEKPANVKWEQLFNMAKKHGVSALCLYSIRKLNYRPDDELYRKWENKNAMLLTKCINQEHEFAAITECFEKHKLPFMPLKGSVIRDLFPLSYLREMGDLDILVPADRINEACDLVQPMNYKKLSTVAHHVELEKPPYMRIELHTGLIAPTYEYYAYYKDPWAKAFVQKNLYYYGMKNEDVYLYLLTHSAKHYYYSGTGIRSVIDVYLFNRAYRSSMDVAYIEQELKKLNLTDFAYQMECLAEHWFSDSGSANSNDVKEMETYILSSATYGTSSNRDANIIRRYMRNGKGEKRAKAAMYLHMAFLPCDEMQLMFPMLKKAPVLLPFCWIARWFRIIFTKPKSITNSYKKVQDIQLYHDEDDS